MQAQSHRAAGDEQAAARALREGIDALEQKLGAIQAEAGASGDGPAEGAEAAAVLRELADLYGILGGTLRQEGDLVAATAAYDAGFRIEADGRSGLLSTYNALNRLITRILLCPACLADPEQLRRQPSLEFLDLPQELAQLHARLHREVAGVRTRDLWAIGDMVLTCALNEHAAGVDAAIEEFYLSSPPPNVFAVYDNSITTLAQLDTPRKDTLVRTRAAWRERMAR